MAGTIHICDFVDDENQAVSAFLKQALRAFRTHEVTRSRWNEASGQLPASNLRNLIANADLVVMIMPGVSRDRTLSARRHDLVKMSDNFLFVQMEEAVRRKKPMISVVVGKADPFPDIPPQFMESASHEVIELDASRDESIARFRRLATALLNGDPDETALQIPAQGYGPHFELDESGIVRFAPPSALDREGNNVDRLRRMHPTVLDLSRELVGALGAGNRPHDHLHRRSKAYNAMIERDLADMDFALLYMEGVRLANAERATTQDGEAPPLNVDVREAIDSLLRIHGSFILASRDGMEAYDAEQRYRRDQMEERAYRSAAMEFAVDLQDRPEIVEAEVAEAAMHAAEEIGQGANPERSGTVATGLLNNLAVTFATGAALGTLTAGAMATGSATLVAITVATNLVGAEGLKKSKPFTELTKLVAKGIDAVSVADMPAAVRQLGQKFRPQLLFFQSAKKALIRMSNGRHELTWLEDAVAWMEVQARSERSVALPVEPMHDHFQPEHDTDFTKILGNIYLAKVTSVERPLQSAFVNFGGDSNGFLAIDDIHPDYYQIGPDERRSIVGHMDEELSASQFELIDELFVRSPMRRLRTVDDARTDIRPIEDLIKRRQVLLVQVIHERPDRGPRLTTFLSVPGRCMTLLPNTALGLLVSPMISRPRDRQRLQRLSIDIPAGMGCYVRQRAVETENNELKDDFGKLLAVWDKVRDMTLKSQAPTLVYGRIGSEAEDM